MYERIFHFSAIKTDYALTPQYGIVGYTSTFFVVNLGSLFLLMNLKIWLLFILWPLRRYKIFCKRVQPRIDKIIEDTYWSSTIEFFNDNYLVFVVCSFLESKSLRFGRSFTAAENYMSALACCGMILSFLFPIAIGRLYMNNLKKIDPVEVPFN